MVLGIKFHYPEPRKKNKKSKFPIKSLKEFQNIKFYNSRSRKKNLYQFATQSLEKLQKDQILLSESFKNILKIKIQNLKNLIKIKFYYPET